MFGKMHWIVQTMHFGNKSLNASTLDVEMKSVQGIRLNWKRNMPARRNLTFQQQANNIFWSIDMFVFLYYV